MENHNKLPSLIGKSTIHGAMFNSYVKLPEGNPSVVLPFLSENMMTDI